MLYTTGLFRTSTRRDKQSQKILNVDVNDVRIHLPLLEIYVGGMVPNLVGLKRDTQELNDDKLSNFTGNVKSFILSQ